MAIINFEWCHNLQAAVNYVTKDRGDDDILSAEGTTPDTAKEEFTAVKRLHNKEDDVQALHLIQSWSPQESKLKSPDDFHQMGRQLVDELFPGHQYIVRTHTDKGHIHNHIIINSVHPETGCRIKNKRLWVDVIGPPSAIAAGENKTTTAQWRKQRIAEGIDPRTRFLTQLRATNDKVALQNGLSVINSIERPESPKLSHVVQKMQHRGRTSWVLDLVQKSDFARSYATSFDEYVDIMSARGINVHVTEKNVSYLYPGQDRRKRGSKLGKMYDRGGLEKKFKENDEKFKARPELRQLIQQSGEQPTVARANSLRIASSLPLDSKGLPNHPSKDYSEYTHIARRDAGAGTRHPLRSENSIIPIEYIREAANKSISDYCAINKIALTQNEKGQSVLKGREHIVIEGSQFRNIKNRRSGTLIDFVVAHKDCTELQAIAQITGNDRLLLLEKHFGEHRTAFKSFYIPKQQRETDGKTAGALQRLFAASGIHSSSARRLSESGRVQSSKGGLLRFLAKDDDSAALDLNEDSDGKWKRQFHGKQKSLFFSSPGRSGKVTVYGDPFQFLKHHSFDDKKLSNHRDGLAVLLAPEELPLDLFMANHKHVKSVTFVLPKNQEHHKATLDLFNVLKAKYRAHGIACEISKDGPELNRKVPEIDI